MYADKVCFRSTFEQSQCTADSEAMQSSETIVGLAGDEDGGKRPVLDVADRFTGTGPG